MNATYHDELRASLASAFAEYIDPASILTHEEERRPYECDGLSAYRCMPLIVVLPEDTEQIQQIMRICYAKSVPVVVRGAGTGLSGGALPLENGVLLNLTRLNRILAIDADNSCAQVQPGVLNLSISEAAKPYGLHYAPDPSSQIACTIGGNVAENAGGVHCLKYGLTVNNLLSLKIVMSDGELITLGGGARLDSPGYDLVALMTGSEGMLGIIVEATVKLIPIAERAQLAIAAFDRVEQAGQAVADIIAAGILPTGLEMMDHLAICAAEDFVQAGYPKDAAAILLCEVDGGNEEVSEEIGKVRHRLLGSGATDVRTAKNEAERVRFWSGRKAAFPAAGRISPDYYCMDGTIPRRYLSHVLGEIEQLSTQFGLRTANVFHAGDGNLHPLILYDGNKPGELELAEQLGGKILELCVEVGGTITGEHGVGIEKLDQMCAQFPPEELTLFHAIKACFDPTKILNPGKAIPTLNRCAEFGAMHIHAGDERFPHLERF